MTITEQLDRLAEYRASQDAVRLELETLRDAILAPVKQQLNDLDAEYQARFDAIGECIQETEHAVKAAVLAHGASVKGAKLHAVWTKGRTSWDTKKLDGLMIAIPQLKECRSEGAPSVSIRTI